MPQGINGVHQHWTCHWSHIDGPVHHGRPSRTLVWICEHPYRTMRTKPCEDCPAAKVRQLPTLVSTKPRRKAARSH